MQDRHKSEVTPAEELCGAMRAPPFTFFTGVLKAPHMPKPGFFRRKSTYLIGVPVIVILAVVVAPFVYIHFIEGPAPKKFALTKPTTGAPAGSTASSASATVSVDGAWKITTGSQAGYRVKETLFGQANTAAGRTGSVKGNLTINGTTVPAADFTVDLTTVKSDQARRDAQFQGRIMDTATFPTATFKLTKPVTLTSIPANNQGRANLANRMRAWG